LARRRKKGSSSGLVTAMGLMRFYEETESKVKVPPEAVIGAAIAISAIAIILRFLVG
jgi:preprotein translocase subunit Sec61beta